MRETRARTTSHTGTEHHVTSKDSFGARGTLTVGDTKQLSATVKDAAGNTIGRPLTWATSDQSIATVSASGLVTAKAPGTATITASADGKSGSLSITVVAPKVTSVTVVPPSAPLSAGKTLTLTATVKDATGATVTDRTVTWTSSDPSKGGKPF